MPAKVLLLVNRSKPEICSSLDEVRAIVHNAGGQIVGEEDALVDGPLSAAQARGAELLMILGGDGTILSQARRTIHLRLPLLGLNFGKLGFLAEFDVATLRQHAGSIFCSGPATLVKRRMMTVRVCRASAPGRGMGMTDEDVGLALNDAVIAAGEPFRMIEAQMSIDGQPGPTAAGDGIVVSTPVGSTAYNASAGGPIMAPDVDAMVITPIAAQSLSFRPVVVSGSSEVTLTMGRVNTPRGAQSNAGVGGTCLLLDGQPVCRLKTNDRVIVRFHPDPVLFVRNPQSNYWDTLVQKMHWAARPRLRGE